MSGTSESPYVQILCGSTRNCPASGRADMFALVEDYPPHTLGYCRMDVAGAAGQ